MTRSLVRKTQPLMEDLPFSKALKSIETTRESGGMKRLLISWAADERLEGHKLPDQILSRKKSLSFRQSAKRTMMEDRGTFRLSGITAAFSMVLVCTFIHNAMFDTYLINFSVDAIVGALGLALAILNLKNQFTIVSFYGKITQMAAVDGLALVLWFLATLAFKGVDSSILIFLVAYFFNLASFKKMQQHFIEENHLEISLDTK